MKSADAYEVFLDVYLHELIDTPDPEILDGVATDAEQKAGLALLASAKAEAGRTRLARTRAALAQSNSDFDIKQVSVSPDEARRFIREAVNDPKFTLAARQLDELSDEDVLRLYVQLTELKSSLGDRTGEDK